jgi:elongator complex protein 3
MTFSEDIITQLRSGQITTKNQLQRAKVQLCKKYRLTTIPQDSDILNALPDDLLDNDDILQLLRLKSTRTLSGVAVIAVMTSPTDCPHGRCTPCPGGPQTQTPQSYTGYEPAAMRALTCHCDPHKQTTSRLKQLNTIGHDTDKIDFIIMGGTFTARTPLYQEWFVRRCYDALNKKKSRTLAQAKKHNETAASRCIGLTIETRPDWLRLHHIDTILDYGATRVELGVQTTDDRHLSQINRGHTVTDSILATRLAKDAGLKICYHLMPGLPGSTPDTDREMFQTIFTDEWFKPDMLKIYPTLIVDGADLANDPDFTPLATPDAVRLLADVKATIPKWIRIQRIQRDIPIQRLKGGITSSNLRQLVASELANRGQSCRCIRCREVGHQQETSELPTEDLRLDVQKYQASGGYEYFLSLTAPRDVLYGYLRLRIIPDPYRPELEPGPAIIVRELRVLGREVPLVGKAMGQSFQHRGLGKRLLTEAETIARDTYGARRFFVLSGIGVKPYYRKLGFIDNGVYLEKPIA